MTKLLKQHYSTTSVIVGIVALLAVVFFGWRMASAQVVSTLNPGDSGAQVTELQTYLATDSSIYPEGLVTGYYGPLTQAAVQRLQCKYGIVCSGDVATTGYGRVGPLTLSEIESLQGSASVPATTNNIEVAAPAMGPTLIVVSPTSATISWTTSQPSENSVLYGLSWPFYLGTAPSAWSNTFGTSASVTLTNLLPGHTYFYVRESVNAAGNVQYSAENTFTTSQ